MRVVYLRNTKYDRSVVDAPVGSMPGSSGDGAQRPPRVKTELERKVDRIEDLMDEVYRIKDECVVCVLEIGERL